MKRRRVLVTGPVRGFDGWVEAPRRAGWVPIAFPLLENEMRDVRVTEHVEGMPDWIVVTSSNALAALEVAGREMPELLSVPAVAVGTATRLRLSALGFAIVDEAFDSVDALGSYVLEQTKPGARILWPRGSTSDHLATFLRAEGRLVSDPVVYATVPAPHEDTVPATDAVFFANPSALQIFLHADREQLESAPAAIALGKTTTRALEELGQESFSRILSLPRPTTEAFEDVLRKLDE